MNYYTLLVTDSEGTYMYEDGRDNIVLFLNQEKAEIEACRIAPNYFLVQVVPYKLDTNYVISDL
jgi:hypothetical protein